MSFLAGNSFEYFHDTDCDFDWETIEGNEATVTPDNDSNDSKEYLEKDCSLVSRLKRWAIKGNVSHALLDDLLKNVLHDYHPDLPLDSRTLLDTPLTSNISIRSSMNYFHTPLRDCLLVCLKKCDKRQVMKETVLKISLNVDGVPLFKSSSTTLWPVLFTIENINASIIPVTVTCGEGKPSNLDFLNDIIAYLKEITRVGITHDNNFYNVELNHVICDMPVKSFVKGTKLCSGYYGCDRCTIKGVWHSEGGSGRVIFPDIFNLTARTDEASDYMHH